MGWGLLLLALAVALALFVPASSWVTVDSGHTITLHGDTSVGPKLAAGKYDLTVMGDSRVGDIDKARCGRVCCACCPSA